MERVEELSKDKVRLVEEYEAKLAKAQECYERELEAMRRTHQLTTENLLAWKRTEVRVHGTFRIGLPYSFTFCRIPATVQCRHELAMSHDVATLRVDVFLQFFWESSLAVLPLPLELCET